MYAYKTREIFSMLKGGHMQGMLYESQMANAWFLVYCKFTKIMLCHGKSWEFAQAKVHT